MAKTAKAADNSNIRAMRRMAGLNQLQFWSRLGVTQSGGSRYESGRSIPKPIRHLIDLVYVLPEKATVKRLEELRKAA